MARRGTRSQDEWSTGFMTLDTTASRANEPGWSREALRADKEKKKADKKAKAKAGRQAVFRAIGNFLGDVWDFILRNLLLALALGASAATGAWEWVNSGRGWLDLYPGLGLWTYVGSAGAIFLWYLGFRKAREEGREPKDKRSMVEITGWAGAAFTGYFVLVAGVFIATATNQIEAQRAAKESRSEFVQLRSDRDALRQKLELYPVEYWEAAIVQDERAIEAQTGIAKGSFEMPNLDYGEKGACAGKLSFNQRRLCAIVNGGVDEYTGERIIGLRAELDQSKRGLKTAKEDAATLADLDAKVRNFKVVTGDETAEAVNAMFGEEKGDAALGWLLLALSSVFLLGSGWATDWVFETIERKRKAGRVKAGKAV
jgi:hypothetical protein